VRRAPRQAHERRLLRVCRVVAFPPEHSHQVAAQLGQAHTADVVDAHVLLIASGAPSTIWTSDPEDLRLLADRVAATVEIRKI
jgi:hypothetical protein